MTGFSQAPKSPLLRGKGAERFLFPILLALVVIIGLLHFFTPGHLSFYHDTYRRLSYFPIVFGALWFGARGGLILALLSSLAYIPHLLLFIGRAPQTYLSELTEVVLYLAAGTLTGIIAGREARLRQKYEELSAKLERSYARLHKQAKILLEAEEQLGDSQRLSALGRLSASLAHEIKNPLSSIRGTAEIFLDEFPVGHPKREFAEILLREVGRLNSTVNEVLRFSRGRPVGSQATESLAQVLERVGKLVEHNMHKKGIVYQATGLEEVTAVQVDGGKLAQVFLNLLLNAVDVLPPHGRIELAVRRHEQGISISVCDNGPGVAPERREEIFKPFMTSKEEGTGLGLPISRRIVEQFNGSLTLEDGPEGQGACFVVRLPRQQSASEKVLA